MKIIIEVNTSEKIDYEYFIDWLNGELGDSSVFGVDIEAGIISVDGEKVY